MFVVWVQSSLTLTLYSTLRLYDVRDDERRSPSALPQSVAAQLAASAPRDTAQALGTGEFYGIEIPMRYWLDVRSVALRLARGVPTSEVLYLRRGPIRWRRSGLPSWKACLGRSCAVAICGP